ncbi:hypothetical protein GOB93_03370 [Acetobacter musti]|uniref:Uncharacterized protein n=1 Tax=Acetobacter musti TaxID=864732 RepID=A0ABX0JM28_9PROT|nr:hypothetical protein [Acetobacter musti]NHN83680.1 hypothetical protein [Acetobacter musti]
MTILNLPAGFNPSPNRVFRVPPAARREEPPEEYLYGVAPPKHEEKHRPRHHRFDEKSSEDVLDYTFDFTEWLQGTSDTITGITPKVMNPLGGDFDLTAVIQGVFNSTKAVIVLASGPPGSEVKLNVTIGTAQGRRKTVRVIVPVNSDTEPTAPPDLSDGVLTIGGVPITIGGNTLSP